MHSRACATPGDAMKTVHQIGLRANQAQRKQLEFLGVSVPPGVLLPGAKCPLVTFIVAEDHPNWPLLRELFVRWDVYDQPGTVFSEEDFQAACWLELRPGWLNGYPQPDDGHFGYLEATYDLSNSCGTCGVGRVQKAPFQIKHEPRWGRRGMFQLNWVFDEHFVTPGVWNRVFQPHGIDCRPVINLAGAELQTVVQLVVREEVDVHTDGLAHERCAECGWIKCHPVVLGPSPAPIAEPTGHMAKTRQYFGSGGGAHKTIVVSKKLVNALKSEGVRGAMLRPISAPVP